MRDLGGLPPTRSPCTRRPTGTDERIHVVHNWSWDAVQVVPPHADDRPAERESLVVDRLDLGPWDVRVLGEQA